MTELPLLQMSEDEAQVECSTVKSIFCVFIARLTLFSFSMLLCLLVLFGMMMASLYAGARNLPPRR